eukprot:g1333.t1
MAMTDRAALSALFRSTGGAEWHRKDNWDSDADLSRWLGVEVDARGRVTHLRLEKNNLKGHIPRQLGDLGALQTLNLGYNELYGPIPPELGNLAALQGLYLGDNTLSGPIPPDLGGLSKLETFWLSKNKLTGPIPPELGNLAALQGLYLGDNTLSGHITPELALSELQVLGLGGNELTGPIPEELGKLTAVKELYLNRNKLSGHIPPELGALSELRVLSLFDNKLTGTIPKELGKLTALQRLSLFGNQLSGPMPPSNFAENPQELSRWVQIRPGQNVDVRMHSHALGAVNVLTSLWHFFLPVLDDATDLWLLLETFGVGETLWVDPLFLALSVVTGGWDDNIAGLTAFSALFSVLELVTELQYYVTEAEDGNSLAAVGDVEDGVGGSENSRTPSGQA